MGSHSRGSRCPRTPSAPLQAHLREARHPQKQELLDLIDSFDPSDLKTGAVPWRYRAPGRDDSYLQRVEQHAGGPPKPRARATLPRASRPTDEAVAAVDLPALASYPGRARCRYATEFVVGRVADRRRRSCSTVWLEAPPAEGSSEVLERLSRSASCAHAGVTPHETDDGNHSGYTSYVPGRKSTPGKHRPRPSPARSSSALSLRRWTPPR